MRIQMWLVIAVFDLILEAIEHQHCELMGVQMGQSYCWTM